MVRAYDEIIDFLAAGTSPRQIIAYRPSDDVRARVEELIAREKGEGLSAEESSELNHYLQLEHLMRLAKARARVYLTSD
jgi:hypothetical protein